MPLDKTLPIIMIATGTAIAPYRSFWQERKWQNTNSCETKKFGEMILYFGCCFSNHDELYSDEIEELLSKSILTTAHVAFSREANRKKVS